jgi:hypothetical protein
MNLKPKKVHMCTVECPHCAKIVDVFKIEETITPYTKAEKRVTWVTEKSVQTTLSISDT